MRKAPVVNVAASDAVAPVQNKNKKNKKKTSEQTTSSSAGDASQQTESKHSSSPLELYPDPSAATVTNARGAIHERLARKIYAATPLVFGYVSAGNLPAFDDYLVNNGDVNVRDKITGMPLLFHAVLNAEPLFVLTLAIAGANLKEIYKQENICSYAISNKKYGSLKWLLSRSLMQSGCYEQLSAGFYMAVRYFDATVLNLYIDEFEQNSQEQNKKYSNILIEKKLIVFSYIVGLILGSPEWENQDDSPKKAAFFRLLDLYVPKVFSSEELMSGWVKAINANNTVIADYIFQIIQTKMPNANNYFEELLMRTVHSQQTLVIEYLLNKHINPDAPTYTEEYQVLDLRTNKRCIAMAYSSPLFRACVMGYSEGVALLLHKMPDVNAALRMTALKEDIIVEDNGNEEKHGERAGYNFLSTPIMVAALKGHASIVELLLKLEIKPNVDATDFYGQTVLINAILSKNEKIVAILLEYGANVEHRNMQEKSVFSFAMDSGDASIIRLIRQGIIKSRLKEELSDGPIKENQDKFLQHLAIKLDEKLQFTEINQELKLTIDAGKLTGKDFVHTSVDVTEMMTLALQKTLVKIGPEGICELERHGTFFIETFLSNFSKPQTATQESKFERTFRIIEIGASTAISTIPEKSAACVKSGFSLIEEEYNLLRALSALIVKIDQNEVTHLWIIRNAMLGITVHLLRKFADAKEESSLFPKKNAQELATAIVHCDGTSLSRKTTNRRENRALNKSVTKMITSICDFIVANGPNNNSQSPTDFLRKQSPLIDALISSPIIEANDLYHNLAIARKELKKYKNSHVKKNLQMLLEESSVQGLTIEGILADAWSYTGMRIYATFPEGPEVPKAKKDFLVLYFARDRSEYEEVMAARLQGYSYKHPGAWTKHSVTIKSVINAMCKFAVVVNANTVRSNQTVAVSESSSSLTT